MSLTTELLLQSLKWPKLLYIDGALRNWSGWGEAEDGQQRLIELEVPGAQG